MASRRILRLVVPAGEAELAADALWQRGASAVATEDVPGGSVRLTADVAEPEAAAAAIPARWAAAVEEVPVHAGFDGWRPHATARRAGRRVVLRPPWRDAAARPGDVVVTLDPGHAFGSGSHATTRLAVALLEDHLRPGQRVLDVGCGSGVLAITACLLGARSAVAVDVDPAAVRATRANAEANGVAHRVDVATGTASSVAGRFDLVLANISGAVLHEIRDDLAGRLDDGGGLVLAGVLDAQAGPLVEVCAPLVEHDRRSEDGWTAVLLRR